MKILAQLLIGILTLIGLAGCSDPDAKFDSLLVSVDQSLQEGDLDMAQEYLELAREAQPQRSEIPEIQGQIWRAEEERDLQIQIDSKLHIVCINLNVALSHESGRAKRETAWEQVASGFRDLAILDARFAKADNATRIFLSSDGSEILALSRMKEVCP